MEDAAVVFATSEVLKQAIRQGATEVRLRMSQGQPAVHLLINGEVCLSAAPPAELFSSVLTRLGRLAKIPESSKQPARFAKKLCVSNTVRGGAWQ